MHKTTTLKDFNVFVLKACLMTMILGFSFQVSFAQKQSSSLTKPTTDEQRKQAQAANNANASAAFGDAVKNESALKPTAASVNTPSTSNDTKKGLLRTNAATDAKPVTTERSAAEIAKKKSGQNQTLKVDLSKKPKSN